MVGIEQYLSSPYTRFVRVRLNRTYQEHLYTDTDFTSTEYIQWEIEDNAVPLAQLGHPRRAAIFVTTSDLTVSIGGYDPCMDFIAFGT